MCRNVTEVDRNPLHAWGRVPAWFWHIMVCVQGIYLPLTLHCIPTVSKSSHVWIQCRLFVIHALSHFTRPFTKHWLSVVLWKSRRHFEYLNLTFLRVLLLTLVKRRVTRDKITEGQTGRYLNDVVRLIKMASHYDDVIMNALAVSDQRKYQSSASLAFVRGIQRSPVTAQRASNVENVFIWRRHHGKELLWCRTRQLDSDRW